MTEPIFIVTDTKQVVPFSALVAFKGEGEGSEVLSQDDRFAGRYGADNLIAPLYNMATLIGLLEINTYHFRCCEVKATDTVGAGWTLESNHEDDLTTEERAVKTAFENNPVSLERVIHDALMDFEATSAFALEIVRELADPDGAPKIIENIPIQTIRPHASRKKFLQKVGVKKRWFKLFGYPKDVDKDNGTEHEPGSLDAMQRASEVIWYNGYSGRSEVYGIPQVIPALGALEGMTALRDYNIDFFRHYGMPAYAVYIAGDYNLGKKVRIRLETDGTGTIGETFNPADPDMHEINFEFPIIDMIKKNLSRAALNPHAPIVLAVPSQTNDSKVEIKFEKLGADIQESSFRLYKSDNRDEIITAHGVPPYRIGITETGQLGSSVAEEATVIYHDSVIQPRQRIVENIFTREIIAKGFELESLSFVLKEFDFSERENAQKQAEFLFRNGGVTPNDLREQAGLARVEGVPELDQYYIDGKPIGMENAETVIKSLHEGLITAIANGGKE